MAPGRLAPNRPILAAIEPWHGHQVVVYTPPTEDPRTVGVINLDALAPIGVAHLDMPLRPSRVWEAIQQARKEQ